MTCDRFGIECSASAKLVSHYEPGIVPASMAGAEVGMPEPCNKSMCIPGIGCGVPCMKTTPFGAKVGCMLLLGIGIPPEFGIIAPGIVAIAIGCNIALNHPFFK
jgi:hypothetical protein